MKISFLLLTGGMEFSWLYPVISILLVPAWGFSLPVYEAILIFGLAAVVTGVSRQRDWLVIQVLLLQLTGIIISFLLSFRTYYYPHNSLFRLDLALNVFNQINNLRQGLGLTAIIISILILWLGGVLFARRPGEYSDVSDRFDKGIAVFVLLFILEGVNIGLGISFIGWFIIYFILSILAIAVSKGSDSGKKEYISGYARFGFIIGFLLLTAGVIIIIFSFGLPYLTGMADTGYGLLKSISRPFLPLLVRVLRFLMGIRSSTTSGSYSTPDHSNIAISDFQQNWLFALIEKLGGYFLAAAGILLVVIIVGWLLYYLWSWLFSRTGVERNDLSIRSYFCRIYNFIKKLIIKILEKSDHKVVPIYNKLLRWGKICGVAKKQSETPEEYSQRLAASFPFLAEEINTVINYYNIEIYGSCEIDEQELKKVKVSWKEIRSFKHWFILLKYRLNF